MSATEYDRGGCYTRLTCQQLLAFLLLELNLVLVEKVASPEQLVGKL
jgi:hypothetical protein